MRVLFVSRDLAFSFAFNAEWLPHTVRSCASVEAALAELESNAFDAIVCELTLPDGTAGQFATRIRAAGNQAPLIVVGPDDERERLGVLGAGADDYLVRSTGLSKTMLAAIRAAQDRRRLAAAGSDSELKVVYVGENLRLFRQFAAAAGVRATLVSPGEDFPQPLDCDVAVIDADGLAAAQPVWRLREMAPEMPIALMADAATGTLNGRVAPFGVDDVIVRSTDVTSQIVPRLRSLAPCRVSARPSLVGASADDDGEEIDLDVPAPSIRPALEPVPARPVAVGEVHVAREFARVPTPVPVVDVPEPVAQPVVPQALTAPDPPVVPAPALAPEPAALPDSVAGGEWMGRLLAISRKAGHADVAARAVADIERILASGTDAVSTIAAARVAASAFSAFAARGTAEAASCVIDDELQQLRPVLDALVGGWADLLIDGGAPGAAVVATSDEIRRVVTALVLACREALPAGGTVSLRTDTAVAPLPADSPVPDGTRATFVNIRVVRAGIAALPVAPPAALTPLASTCAGQWRPVSAPDGCAGVVLSLPAIGAGHAAPAGTASLSPGREPLGASPSPRMGD
jgi:CheY-like chemotaxis protein